MMFVITKLPKATGNKAECLADIYSAIAPYSSASGLGSPLNLKFVLISNTAIVTSVHF